MERPDQTGESASDDTVLDQWARTYRPALLRYVKRRAPPYIDAEDVVQNVFIRVSRRAGLAAIEFPERYLFTAASSALSDAIRMGRVRKADQHMEFDESILIESDFSSEQVLIGRQGVAQMIEALQELPQRQRSVFFLYHFENLLQTDVAEMLGVSLSTVENDMRKATAYLLMRLDKIL